MKSRMTRLFFAFCLCITLLSTSSSSLKAETEYEMVKSSVDELLYQTDLYVFDDSVRTTFYLGEKATAYRVSGSSLAAVTNISIYPIYRNSNIVGLAILNSDGSLSIGKMYASALNSSLDASKGYSLVFDNTEVYLAQEDGVEYLGGYGTTLSDSNRMDSLCASLNFGAAAQKESMAARAKRDYGYTINTFPHRSMVSGSDCWAACVAAAVTYKGTNISATSVVSATGNAGSASTQQVSDYLTNIYNVSNTLYTYALGFNTAMSNVGNNRPILINATKVGGGVGHMVAIKGVWYLTTSQSYDAKYVLMDPYFPLNEISVYTTTTANLTFTSCGSNSYQWYQSIVIN